MRETHFNIPSGTTDVGFEVRLYLALREIRRKGRENLKMGNRDVA